MERIAVKNTCPWRISFKSADFENGLSLNPLEETTLSADEIAFQIKTRNEGFIGIDGSGKHAPIQLMNLEQYNKLFGVEKTKLPDYFSESVYKKLVKLKDRKKFQDALEKNVITESDKRRLIYMIRGDKNTLPNLPDWMMWAVETHTGMKIEAKFA